MVSIKRRDDNAPQMNLTNGLTVRDRYPYCWGHFLMYYLFLKIEFPNRATSEEWREAAYDLIRSIQIFLEESNITATVEVAGWDMICFGFPDPTGVVAFKLRYSDILYSNEEASQRIMVQNKEFGPPNNKPTYLNVATETVLVETLAA